MTHASDSERALGPLAAIAFAIGVCVVVAVVGTLVVLAVQRLRRR